MVEAVGGSSVGSGWADEFRSRAAPPSGWADEFTQHQAAQAAGQPPQPYQQQQQAGGRAGEWADDFARGLQQRQQAGGWTEDWARDFASGLQLGEGPEAAAAAAAMMEGAWADGMQAGPAGSGWADEFQQQGGEEAVFEVGEPGGKGGGGQRGGGEGEKAGSETQRPKLAGQGLNPKSGAFVCNPWLPAHPNTCSHSPPPSQSGVGAHLRTQRLQLCGGRQRRAPLPPGGQAEGIHLLAGQPLPGRP